MTPVSPASAVAQPAPSRRASARVAELDGLRGIAILLVLVYHFTPTTGPLHVLAPLFQVGWSGVDLFFVLSGFLITGILVDTAGRPHYYRNFLVRRSLRIFPLYYVCLVLYAFLTFSPTPIRWHDFLGPFDGGWYFFYLGNIRAFLRAAWPPAAMLTPLWSLQVEEQFYWTFPFLVASVTRKSLGWILAGSVAAALLFRVALAIAMPANTLGPYVLMPCRMDALAMGGLVALAVRQDPSWLKRPWIGRLTWLCGAIFVGVYFAVDKTPWPLAMRTFGYTVGDLWFTGILILLLNAGQTTRASVLLRVCRVRILVRLGTISYGLYLLHIPVLVVVDRFLGPALHITVRGSVAFFISFALAIAAASLSWVGFESQILRLKHRFTAG
ncbi:MAG TPA: acyltransferase [Bryobacteraceae bacterium]|jgi:peptidoglycan/LPS O-acetylase OafA/YrhL